MKKLHWLNLAEYASAIGLGVGAVASVVTRQMLYTSAPISFLVLLNLASRRRFEQMAEKNTAIAFAELDQKVAKHVELLNQQILSMPTPETVGNVRKSLLRKDRESLERVAGEIKKIRQEMNQRLHTLEDQSLTLAREDVSKLQDQYGNLSEALGTVTAHLHRLSSSVGLDNLGTEISQLKTEVSQIQTNLQSLSDQTKPSLTSLQDQVNHLNRQFQKMPPPFDSTALKNEVAELIKMVSDLVPKRDWNAVVAEIQALHRQQESQAQVEDDLRQSITTLSQQIQMPAAPPDVTRLKEQIRRLEQQVQKIPPPVDISAIEQRVEELIQAANNAPRDVVPKRDWTVLVAQFKALHQQQKTQSQLGDRLRDEIKALHKQMKELPGRSQVRTQVEEMLRHQLLEINQQLDDLRKQDRSEQSPLFNKSGSSSRNTSRRKMRRRSQPNAEKQNGNHLVTLTNGNNHDQPNLSDLSQSTITDVPIEPIRTQEEFQGRIEDMLRRELQDINHQLQSLPNTPEYEFVLDVGVSEEEDESDESDFREDEAIPVDPLRQLSEGIINNRDVLEAALSQTKEHLVLIWPWSRQCDMDDDLEDQFRHYLETGRRLDLGWCHLANRNEERFLSSIMQRWNTNSQERRMLQDTLQRFLKLKREFPDRFQFQILGAIENFLVSDQSFAVLGVDNVLVTQDILPDLEVKLRTTDPDVIQRLLDRFETLDLDPDDLEAHWNRAVTRHDLGDRPGALSDLSHIIESNGNDAAAYNHRGTVRYDLKDLRGALADFNQSIQLNPSQVAAYCNRGLLRVEANDLQGAIADYSMAIQAHPDAAIAYFYRGMAYQKQKNLPNAIKDYTEALQLAPDSAVAHYHRAIVSQKVGDRDMATTDFATAADLFQHQGSETNAEKALRSLQKLQAIAS